MSPNPGAISLCRPPDAAGHAFHIQPESPLPLGAHLVVGPTEVCALLQYGQVLGVLPPGQHALDPGAMPALASVVSGATATAAVAFVTTVKITEQFGGPLGNVMEPKSRANLAVAVQGTFGYRVESAEVLLQNLAGMGSPSGEDLAQHLRTTVLGAMKGTLSVSVMRQGWALSDVAGGKHSEELGAATQAEAGPQLAQLGIQLGSVRVEQLMVHGLAPAPAPKPAPAAGAGGAAMGGVAMGGVAMGGAVPGGPMAGGGVGGVAAGQRVLAQYEGEWYEATLGGIQGPMAQIRWDDGTESPVPFGTVRQSVPVRLSPPDIQAGQRVMARFGDAFYEATVGALGPGQVGIRWDDGTESWVAETEVRRLT